MDAHFNSRSHVGNDPQIRGCGALYSLFQFTFPRGERPRYQYGRIKSKGFQFTFPRGERRGLQEEDACRIGNFNSRSHVGNDCTPGTACKLLLYFNSRSHVGNDPFVIWKEYFYGNFNSRSHVGTWIEIAIKILLSYHKRVVPHVGTWIEIQQQFASCAWSAVVPHVGTWIEISNAASIFLLQSSSFPTWERELKSFALNPSVLIPRSFPTWERELK